MSQPSLHDLLAALHAKLHERQHAATHDRSLIREVMSDLDRLLQSEASAPTPAGASGLAAQVVRLEAAHPDLVPIIRRIVDTLGQAGV